jgi:hypothetical protein
MLSLTAGAVVISTDKGNSGRPIILDEAIFFKKSSLTRWFRQESQVFLGQI